MSASDLNRLAFTQTWQVIALTLVVFFFSKSVARKNVHLIHVLWLVVLIKCLVPPILSSPAGVFCWIDFSERKVRSIANGENPRVGSIKQPSLATRSRPVLDVSRDIATSTDVARPNDKKTKLETAMNAVPQKETTTRTNHRIQRAGLAIWIGGITLVFLLLSARTLFCFHRIRRAGLVENKQLTELTNRLRDDLNIARPVRILITESRIGPLVYGLLRPTILIPRLVFERSVTNDLIPILAHELIHVRRGDLWVNLFQTLANAVWWFNPLVWLANRNVSRVAESCCDEQTVASLGCSSTNYARSLIRILELKRSLSTVPAFPGIRPVEITSKRLERIMKLRQGCHKRTPKWCWGAMTLMMTVSLPGAAWVIGSDPEPWKKVTKHDRAVTLDATINPEAIPAKFDQFAHDAPQIAIETRFVTLPVKASRSIRIDWSYLQVPPRTKSDAKAKKNVKTRNTKTPRQPQGRSQTVIETNEPVRFAMLTQEQKVRLLKSIQEMKTANVLQAPKVTLFNRQTASISDSCQRPFIVGFHDNDHQLQIISEGTVIDCRPEALDDGAVWLDLTATYSEIRDVRESTITKPSSAERITVQIPEVQRTAIGVELEVPAEQTLLLVGSTRTNPKAQAEQLLVMISPRVLPNQQIDDNQAVKNADGDLRDPTRTAWDLSLDDCIQIALKNSKVTRSIGQIRTSSNGSNFVRSVDPNVSLDDFEANVRNLVTEVIRSYWELYFYYQNLDTAKTGRDAALLTWRQTNAKVNEQKDRGNTSMISESQEQYYFFRRRTEEAQRDLSKAERQLRFLAGLANDGRTIRPSDEPTKEERSFDWQQIQIETLKNSSEVKRHTRHIAE